MGDNLGPNGLRMGSNHDARRLGIAVRSIRLNGSGTAIELDYAAPALAEAGSTTPSRRRDTGGLREARRCRVLRSPCSTAGSN
jgi:hypothetical protein